MAALCHETTPGLPEGELEIRELRYQTDYFSLQDQGNVWHPGNPCEAREFKPRQREQPTTQKGPDAAISGANFIQQLAKKLSLFPSQTDLQLRLPE